MKTPPLVSNPLLAAVLSITALLGAAACGVAPEGGAASPPPGTEVVPGAPPADGAPTPDVVEASEASEVVVASLSCPDDFAVTWVADDTAVPDLRPGLRWAGVPVNQAGWEVTQQPAPGTAIEELGEVTVALHGEGTTGLAYDCDVHVAVEDHTAPDVFFGFDANARLLASELDGLEVGATDDTSDAVVELRLDGEPWSGEGAPSVGYHELTVRAQDDSGNETTVHRVFQVADRPLHTALANVSFFTCEQLAEDVYALETQVVLGAEDFDPKDIKLYSVHLWALDDDGAILNDETVRLAGSVDPEAGGYAYWSTEAFYSNGLWQLQFRTNPETNPLPGCPHRLWLTGHGEGDDGAFEFGAGTDAEADEDPLDGVDHVINDDAGMAPPQEAYLPGCRWRGEVVNPDYDERVFRFKFGEYFHHILTLDVSDGLMSGDATAFDTFASLSSDVNDAAEVNGRAGYHVWLEGPENCGCEPEVACTFVPEFKVRVEMNSPAKAAAWGVMDLRSRECGLTKTAKGGLQIGDDSPTEVEVELAASVSKKDASASAKAKFELTMAHGNTDETIYDVGATDRRTVAERDVRVDFYTRAKERVSADSAIYDMIAKGRAELKEARRGMTLEATCGDAQQTFRW